MGTIDQINASLTHALSTLPGQERECRIRLCNVRAELQRIDDVFYANQPKKANQ